MRVRVLKPAVGVVDGVSLSRLVPGGVYELKPITANYLISQRCAEEVPASQHPVVTPQDDPTFLAHLSRGVSVTLRRPHAADRPRRKRKRTPH